MGWLMSWQPRCSPLWSLSPMDYCKSRTPRPPHLQPGSSPLPENFLWNSKWCCASARWDQARRSSRAKRVRRHSGNWRECSSDLQFMPSFPPSPLFGSKIEKEKRKIWNKGAPSKFHFFQHTGFTKYTRVKSMRHWCRSSSPPTSACSPSEIR